MKSLGNDDVAGNVTAKGTLAERPKETNISHAMVRVTLQIEMYE